MTSFMGKMLVGTGAALMLLGTLGACASPAKEQTWELKLAHIFAPEFAYARIATAFKNHIEKATDGRVKVKIYPAGQLYGSFEAQMDGHLAGAVEVGYVNQGLLSTYDKRWGLLASPGYVGSPEHMRRLEKTPAFQELARDLEAIGMKYIGFMVICDSYIFWNKVRPVKTIDDLKGLKLSTLASESYIGMIKTFGASYVALPIAEMNMALAQGTIDGLYADKSLALVATHSGDFLPYATEWTGFSGGNGTVGFTINSKTWESIPPDLQQAILDEVPACAVECQAIFDEYLAADWEAYTAKATITVLSREESEAFKELVEEKITPVLADKYGWDLYDACEATR